MSPLSSRYRSKSYLDAVDATDFQYANFDFFHTEHDKAVLEATLLDNRGVKVEQAGGIHNYLAERDASTLNHNNSLGGFFFEHLFPYYSHATAAGPINHPYIDRMGMDGQTYQDYAGHSWSNLQNKVYADHQAAQFTITDDFYRWLQRTHPDFLEHHPNILPASGQLPFGVDNKRLGHDIADARNAELNPFWFVEELAFTEAFVAGSLVITNLVVHRSLDGVGLAVLRAGGQQTFVMGSEALLDLVPQIGIGHLSGHALTEGYNLELYGAFSAIYVAAEMFCTNRDLTNRRKFDIIGQRTQLIVAKVAVSKGVAVIGSKIVGLSAKGATIGTAGGPLGTVAGFALGLGVALGGGWYFHYRDAKIAAEHERIFVEVTEGCLLAA